MKKLYKQFNMEVEEIGTRKMAFVISTASVDRDGDSIDSKGWQLKNFQNNPVVLWAHDYSQLPIGRAVNIVSTDKGLRAEVEFPPLGTYPFADQVHDMVKAGFLNATSVGFAPSEYEKAKDRERGYDFKSQELLEFSIVPVPCNPEALVQRGVKSEQLQKYAKVMRHWSKDILGDAAPKLDAEQFDNLADAIAKIMHEETPTDDKKGGVDHVAVATEVARILKEQNVIVEIDYKKIATMVITEMNGVGNHEEVISKDVLDLKDEVREPEILWGQIDIPEPAPREFEFSAKEVSEAISNMMQESLRQEFKELVGAEARAAIKYMTGRLD